MCVYMIFEVNSETNYTCLRTPVQESYFKNLNSHQRWHSFWCCSQSFSLLWRQMSWWTAFSCRYSVRPVPTVHCSWEKTAMTLARDFAAALAKTRPEQHPGVGTPSLQPWPGSSRLYPVSQDKEQPFRPSHDLWQLQERPGTGPLWHRQRRLRHGVPEVDTPPRKVYPSCRWICWEKPQKKNSFIYNRFFTY